jgi:hypothetical protein
MSNETTQPSASTVDGNFFRSNKRRKGFFGLGRRDLDRQSPASTANSLTKTAQLQTTPTPPLTKALVNADRGVAQDRRVAAKVVPQKHQRDEQRRSDAAPAGNNPAERLPEKPTPKEQIEGIDAELYHKLVNEVGAPARRKKHISTGLADKMHKAGWSYRQIAEHFGVSPCTVRRRLREAKLLK